MTLVASGYIVLFVYWMFHDAQFFAPIAQKQFPAVIGLPFAALAALCIVLFLEFYAGQIELEGFGFKFRGASGPAIIWLACWLACFLGIAGAIKMLWR